MLKIIIIRELVEENNMKYLNYKFPKFIENTAYNFWPRFAASQIFFSSIIDTIIAQANQ